MIFQIHGDKSQMERDFVLRQFRTGKSNILVATDVAARGLDVEGIQHVVNFDYPQSSEDYVHRIGRTGRSDNKGTSYAFFTDNNARQAQDLIKVLQEAKQEIPPKLAEMANRRHRNGNGFDRARRYGFSGGRSNSYRGGSSWGNNGGGGGGGGRNGNYNNRKTFD